MCSHLKNVSKNIQDDIFRVPSPNAFKLLLSHKLPWRWAQSFRWTSPASPNQRFHPWGHWRKKGSNAKCISNYTGKTYNCSTLSFLGLPESREESLAAKDKWQLAQSLSWTVFSSARSRTRKQKATPRSKCWPAQADFVQHLIQSSNLNWADAFSGCLVLCFGCFALNLSSSLLCKVSTHLSNKPMERAAPTESIPSGPSGFCKVLFASCCSSGLVPTTASMIIYYVL